MILWIDTNKTKQKQTTLQEGSQFWASVLIYSLLLVLTNLFESKTKGSSIIADNLKYMVYPGGCRGVQNLRYIFHTVEKRSSDCTERSFTVWSTRAELLFYFAEHWIEQTDKTNAYERTVSETKMYSQHACEIDINSLWTSAFKRSCEYTARWEEEGEETRQTSSHDQLAPNNHPYWIVSGRHEEVKQKSKLCMLEKMFTITDGPKVSQTGATPGCWNPRQGFIQAF